MNVIYNLPVTIDNSKEREDFRGFCRSFYWKLSRDYRCVRKLFISGEDGFEFRTKDATMFLRTISILDLSLVSFTYYKFLDTFVVVVKSF